jgi:ApbE superfamily uncharacterized protein (UPF0280 family)
MELFSDRVLVKETNLLVKADNEDAIGAAYDAVLKARSDLEAYIRDDPFFQTAMEPVEIRDDAPRVVKLMAIAGRQVGIGPMAAVAGTISQVAAEAVASNGAKNVFTENGGDICIIGDMEFAVGLYAGSSPLSRKYGLVIPPELLPIGICTSSGTVGHSISLGNADAAIVLSRSTPVADAAATAIANEVATRDEVGLQAGIERAKALEGIMGVIIIVEDLLGTWGKLPEIVTARDFDVVTG